MAGHLLKPALMNRRLKRSLGLFLRKLAGIAGPLAALALVIATSGCASSRPAPVLVEHQVTTLPTSNPEMGQSLKLVTYNIWGLPSWMTGARSGRYPRIARELERLDPDIILLQEAWTGKARKSAPGHRHWS